MLQGVRLDSRPVVILGFGVAATSALAALREAGYSGPVTVLTDADPRPYSPVLTSYYAGGRIPREACFAWDDAAVTTGDTEVRHHVRIEALDIAGHRVVLASGEAVRYSKLLIATGACPVSPGFPKVEGAEPLVLRTMADADRLHDALARGAGKKVLVCGTSMVGLKVVEACLDRGAAATLLGRSEHILRGTAHPLAAGRFERLLEERGVKLRLSHVVAGAEYAAGQGGWLIAYDAERARFDGSHGTNVVNHAGDPSCEGGPSSAGSPSPVDAIASHADGGSRSVERFDEVVLAQGVKPNLDFISPDSATGSAADAPALEIDRGVVVDRFMRASAPDVFAAGDVAQALDLETGDKRMRGLWLNAVRQGRCAGRAMADELAGRAPARPFTGSIAQNVIHVRDLLFASAGSVDERPGRRIEVRECPGELAVFAYERRGAREGLVGINVVSQGHHGGTLVDRIGEYCNAVKFWHLDCGCSRRASGSIWGDSPNDRGDSPNAP